jgi:hypothetical protein
MIDHWNNFQRKKFLISANIAGGKERKRTMLGTILLVVLILLLIGALPNWGYSSGWGYGPSGGLGLVVVIILVLLLMGRI